MTVDSGDPAPEPSRLIHDGKATLDLRTRPTRESMRIPDGMTGNVEQSPRDKDVDVTVLLPTGDEVHIPAYAIANETGVIDGTGQPDRTVVNVHYATDADFAKAIYAQADALGLRDEDLLEYVGSPPRPDGSQEQSGVAAGVLDGLYEGFLYIEVDLQGRVSRGGVAVNYLFNYDLAPLPEWSPSALPD